MCWKRYKGYHLCGHQDPDGTPLAVQRCGEPDRHPWEPECAEKEWKLVHNGNKQACPACSAQSPSVATMLRAHLAVPQQLRDVGLGPEKIRAFQAFGKEGLGGAERERKRGGPASSFYEVLLEAYNAFIAESRRLVVEMVDEQETKREQEEEKKKREQEEEEEGKEN